MSAITFSLKTGSLTFSQFTTHMGQSWVEIEHDSHAYLPCSKCYSAELLLRVGLMHAALMHGYLKSLHSAYEPHP